MDVWIIILVVILGMIIINRVDDAVARRREVKLDRKRELQPICGCCHHYAYHDPTTGHCHATHRKPSRWDEFGRTVAWGDVQCGCRQYVGPQPLETYYAPEITSDTTIRPRLDKGDDTEEH